MASTLASPYSVRVDFSRHKSAEQRPSKANAIDTDDRTGKEGVLVAIVTHDELVILGRLAGAIGMPIAAVAGGGILGPEQANSP